VAGRQRLQLTQELIDQFSGLILRGLPIDGACDYLSISPAMFWYWMKMGERWLNSGEAELLGIEEEDFDKLGEADYYETCGRFIKTMRKAMAEYRLETLDKLHADKTANWTKSMTILERRDRKNFSRADQPGGNVEKWDADERFL